MACDIFLKLDGIKGESADDKHKGEIDIMAWSWGMNQSGTMHTASGGGAGKVAVQDISLTKHTDSSSPNLIQHCCSGKHIPTAWLTVRKAGGKPVEYIKMKLEDVLISSISNGGSGGEDLQTEHVTLNFGRFEYIYTPQKADGSPDAEITKTWNIAKNAEK
jgi:type VI secretion system secreted protein Hcp